MPYPKLKDQLCPYCGKHVNRAGNLDDPKLQPVPGDVIICLECGEPAILESAGVRKPTAAEQVELNDNDDYWKHRFAWLLWRQGHGRGQRKPGDA